MICPVCQKDFTPSKSTQQVCSAKCRKAKWKADHEAKQLPAQRGGTETLLDEGLQKRICELVANGMYPSVAFRKVGLHHSTYVRWKQRGEEGIEPYASFVAGLEEAEVSAEALLVDRWFKEAHQGDDWRAARDFLQRRHPERWGRIVEEKRIHAEFNGLNIQIFPYQPTEKPERPAIDLNAIEITGYKN